MKLPAIFLLMMVAAGCAMAQVSVSVQFGHPPYYGYAPREVAYVQQWVPAYEVPRVLFIARSARVPVIGVVDLYRHGWGCDRMAGYYGIAPYPPAPYVMPYAAPHRVGPPYGRAWGHWKHGRGHYDR